jgi:hypothetical protein
MNEAKKIPPLQVRVPTDLKAWLKEQAQKNHRSLNGELVYRLERSRQQEGAPRETA